MHLIEYFFHLFIHLDLIYDLNWRMYIFFKYNHKYFFE